MKLHELKPAEGSRKVRNRVVVVLHLVMVKLQAVVKRSKARSGGGVRPGFEGGQNSIVPSSSKTWIH